MPLFQVKFLFQLVDLDLQLDAIFAVVVAHLEHIKLQLVVADPQSLVLVAEVALNLLGLQDLHFKATDLLFENVDTIREEVFRPHLLLSFV